MKILILKSYYDLQEKRIVAKDEILDVPKPRGEHLINISYAIKYIRKKVENE